MPRLHTSRRTTGQIEDSDCDHEISLVDHDGRGSTAASSRPMSQQTTEMVRSNTELGLLAAHEEEQEAESSRQNENTGLEVNEDNERGADDTRSPPPIEVQAATPNPNEPATQSNTLPKRTRPKSDRETAIDILYENERGGFLCGIALFASNALGALDPPAWTNVFHKPSPTNIRTAQVPDPSWEWAWPDWRINHQEGMDEHGWEYSFAFSKKFSWHKSKWWNSFVRRRAWIRMRVKKKEEDISSDPHMLRTDYFNVQSAASRGRSPSMSSMLNNRMSMSQMSKVSSISAGPDLANIDIEDGPTLMALLRLSRIDREKIEALSKFLQQGTEFSVLKENMHEIMALFVFQASRRKLLSQLIQTFDETTEMLEKDGENDALRRKNKDLEGAVKRADEEVRKLAYWSDVKRMAESGESKGAVDGGKGWGNGWEGVDKSGPSEPNNGELP